VFGLLCTLSVLVVGTASAASLKDFDHLDTGFPLSGKHSNTACDSCHLDGKFKGTPNECDLCHNAKMAKGKSPSHIASNDECDDCHTTSNFSKATVDHGSVIGVCTYCHKTTPSGHIATTTTMCDDCHSTFAWTPAMFDHNSVVSGCKDCHVKSQGHVEPTSKNCEECHSVTTWKTKFDHSNISASCVTCHSQNKSAKHPNTSDICGDCHKPTQWSDVIRTDHSTVTECRSCHKGQEAAGKNHPSSGADCILCHANAGKNWQFDHHLSESNVDCKICHVDDRSSGKSASHPQTSDKCGDCHAFSKGWGNVSKFNHKDVSECRSCHQSKEPKGKKHPSTTDECEACHTNFGTSRNWDFNHSVSSTNYDCVFCHNGSVSKGKSKSASHSKASNDCATCHSTNDWAYVNKFDHSGVTECRSCHDKSQTKAKSHPATSAECDLCHTNIGLNWKLSHNDASSNFDCVYCHNGKITGGKSKEHPQSKNDCGTCHTSQSWKPKAGSIDHSDFKTCNQCHTYSVKTKPNYTPKHVKTTAECIECHRKKGSSWSFNNHKNAETLLTCNDCHADNKAKINHPDTSNQCKTCHKISPARWSELVRPFPHTAAKLPCSQCHDLLKQNPSHFSTSGDCGSCHSSTTWATSGKPDHSQSTGRCSDCHNGTTATGKNSRRHIPSSGQCGDCHTSDNWFVPTTTVHKIVSGRPCFDCHNGRYPKVRRKGGNHVLTSEECGDCHNTTKWKTINVDHGTISSPCSSCHTTPPIPTQHFDILNLNIECDECHTSTAPGGFQTKVNYVHISPAKHTGRTHDGPCKDCHTTNTKDVNWNPGFSEACASCHERDFRDNTHLDAVPEYTPPLSNDTEFWDCNTSCHGTGVKHSTSNF